MRWIQGASRSIRLVSWNSERAAPRPDDTEAMTAVGLRDSPAWQVYRSSLAELLEQPDLRLDVVRFDIDMHAARMPA